MTWLFVKSDGNLKPSGIHQSLLKTIRIFKTIKNPCARPLAPACMVNNLSSVWRSPDSELLKSSSYGSLTSGLGEHPITLNQLRGSWGASSCYGKLQISSYMRGIQRSWKIVPRPTEITKKWNLESWEFQLPNNCFLQYFPYQILVVRKPDQTLRFKSPIRQKEKPANEHAKKAPVLVQGTRKAL